jgi:hypothetical protein
MEKKSSELAKVENVGAIFRFGFAKSSARRTASAQGLAWSGS